MKSKKRHQSSSEESEESEASVKSSSSSDSESEESSESEHRHKKKKKHDSSQSESDSDDQKRSKKRKHKKKKKKHSKKKRRSDSVQGISVEEISMSEGEISSKKKRKHKHKHSKRARGSSASEGSDRVERRLHSVVKEKRASSEEGSQPSRTYYQRDYHQSASGEEEPAYDREREVQRFYRGSSKERALRQTQHYEYERERERTDKYASSYQDKNYQPKYGQSVPYKVSNEEYSQSQKQRQYDEYRRHHQRYEDRRPAEEHHSRPRENYYSKEDPRGYNNQNRYNQHGNHYEGQPKRQFNDNREYHQRRGPPPEPDHYREKEYPDKRERYQDRYSERPREPRHSKPPPPVRTEKTIPPPRDYTRSGSQEEHFKNRRPEPREEREREDRYRESGRGDAREREESRARREERAGRGGSRDGRGDERPSRSEDRRPREERRDEQRPVKVEPQPRERKTRFENEDKGEYSWGKAEVKKEGSTSGDKEKPNFGLSGKLTADANTVNGVVIKYTEPEDAKQPKRRWRFYPFKGDKALPILYIHRQSAFLIGRDKKVVDIILEHPSISKQHAALQYRATPFERTDGSTGRRVRPYIIDLESANGTFVNNKKIEPRRYVELLERDVVKFGFSQREYVLLHENSKDDAQDDDNQPTPALGAAVTLTEQVKMEKRMKQETAEDGE